MIQLLLLLSLQLSEFFLETLVLLQRLLQLLRLLFSLLYGLVFAQLLGDDLSTLLLRLVEAI